MAWKLCKGCDQPMLPKGSKKKPFEFDHATGCPIDPKQKRTAKRRGRR